MFYQKPRPDRLEYIKYCVIGDPLPSILCSKEHTIMALSAHKGLNNLNPGENVNNNIIMCFITEETKETILGFSQGIAKVL